PYFRIFNPESQLKKFDSKARYVRKWVPEFGTPAYPKPIVNHKEARERCLRVYKEGIAKARG
ncbi:MAG: FAD-binding domain-containing protein, partial [Bacteroidia bacterium]